MNNTIQNYSAVTNSSNYNVSCKGGKYTPFKRYRAHINAMKFWQEHGISVPKDNIVKFYIDVAKCKIKGAIFDCFEKTLVKAFTKHKK